MIRKEDINILIVDDDPMNRECGEINLQHYLGYEKASSVDDGTTGIEYLTQHPDTHIILLDRMMGKMNGVPMLNELKKQGICQESIVIFQTGEVSDQHKQECIDAGGLYLLQKPYNVEDMEVFIDPISNQILSIDQAVEQLRTLDSSTQSESFTFSTLEELPEVVAKIARHFPEPKKVTPAIYELVSNAIEHGVYGIGYKQKNNLLKKRQYFEHLSSLEKGAESRKSVSVEITHNDEGIAFTIVDPGTGISESDLSRFDADHIREPNGRGIYKAMRSFDKVAFTKNGNSVTCMLHS